MREPASHSLLPPGVRFIERGWLSSNALLIEGGQGAALVDSGYWTHAAQTVQLVRSALDGWPLSTLVNTHLHSDHCGGNAALQAAFPLLRTWIPPGQAAHVRQWDAVALTYEPTGQHCPPFRHDAVLVPGSTVALGDLDWEVHAAPGHDPHSVVLFEPRTRTLASADALWENGFGVVFPELEGERAFDLVAETLDVIERLAPAVVAPGHGALFTDVGAALARSRSRLAAYAAAPDRHAAHAAKVLLKFKLLEWQQTPLLPFVSWASETAYFRMVHKRWFADQALESWIHELLQQLSAAGAADLNGVWLRNR